MYMQILSGPATMSSAELSNDIEILLAIYRDFVAEADPANTWSMTRETIGVSDNTPDAVSIVDCKSEKDLLARVPGCSTDRQHT